ncbi:MAG: tRNA (adenosine(37)-N6)-threonylcarbamoyltransferase complex dimerization subunit type 1 TsaB [Bacilli bacterium]
MYKLFIDTHSSIINISFIKGNTIISKEKESIKSHSEFTLPLIKEIMDKQLIKFSDIEEIIVVSGPGSFTGIRIGITIAKVMAVFLPCKIKTITSLECFLVSNETTNNKISLIEDNNGFYLMVMDKDNNIMLPPLFTSNSSLYIKDNEVVNNKLDIMKIIEYSSKLSYSEPHNTKATYIKVIEAQK